MANPTPPLPILLLLLPRRGRAQDPVQDLGDDPLAVLAEDVGPGARVDVAQRGREDGQVLDRLAARQEGVLGALREHLLLEQLGGDDGGDAQAMPAQQAVVARLEPRREVVPLRDAENLPEHGARRPDEPLRARAGLADEQALQEDLVGLAAHAQRDAGQQLEGADGRGALDGRAAVELLDEGGQALDGAVVARLDLGGLGDDLLRGVLAQGEVDDLFASQGDVEVAAESYKWSYFVSAQAA